ncbi:MAG: Bug family tripartite tricarboxylate transporter substrate binding protein [Lautropia sp.]
MRDFLRRAGLLSAAIVLLGGTAAWAQDYPAHPVKLIVPYPPGGTLDLVARGIAKLAEPSLGRPIVADNRPGATGVLAHGLIANAPADGYTIGISGLSPLALAPHQYLNLPYHPIKSFSYLACFGDTPLVLDVAAGLPVKDIAGLVAYAKANPGKLNFGSAGLGNASHLAAELFKKAAGIDIVHVPYKGNALAMNDLLSGQIQVLFDPPQTTLPQLATGRIRSLGVTSTARFAGLPDVPTIAESGYPDYSFSIWYAMIAPAGLPVPIVDRLNAEINKVVRDPAVRKQFAAQGSSLYESDPRACSALAQQQYDQWARVFADLGIKPQ